jgi:GGDEF domain-containing protein
MGLPERGDLLRALDEMLTNDERPALFLVAVHGLEGLALRHGEEAVAAMREIVGRLGRLTRSNDQLAVLSNGVFALAGPGIERTDTAVLIDRLRGVFALPVEVGEQLVSFPVTAGIAHHVDGIDSARLLAEAEADLDRRLRQRQRSS